MTEASDPSLPEPTLEELRAETAALTRQLQEVTEAARARIIRAELKAEAIKAGMIDLDGLKLIEPTAVKLDDKGEVEGAGALMTKLKREKPWLFGAHSSSSRATPPHAEPPRQKHASEMTAAEYRAARAEMLRRR
ncbi:MAG: hypothetical protein LGL72_01965 [Acidibrevibacterium sp.]|jgi:hypothetical protein|uniref:phage scaffolding protein n=1 Tax=Acidibrevibacterium fodinaquatile TaxID=1969806 RepID=UPI0023A7AA28|nr:hypothetical protein [Acidibrevibacterium fodinaquatile]MCA7118190.1 hypothetical protein [Acidibrevibacterium fodinaquatile]